MKVIKFNFYNICNKISGKNQSLYPFGYRRYKNKHFFLIIVSNRFVLYMKREKGCIENTYFTQKLSLVLHTQFYIFNESIFYSISFEILGYFAYLHGSWSMALVPYLDTPVSQVHNKLILCKKTTCPFHILDWWRFKRISKGMIPIHINFDKMIFFYWYQ